MSKVTLHIGDETRVFRDNCSLKTERASQSRLSAWLILQLCLCPRDRAKALACLALVYEQAYIGCIWHVCKVLHSARDDPGLLHRRTNVTLTGPLADKQCDELWEGCISLRAEATRSPCSSSFMKYIGTHTLTMLESSASLQMLADTFGQMSFPDLPRRRRSKNGYRLHSSWASRKDDDSSDDDSSNEDSRRLELQAARNQHKACRAVFQWQIIWSALTNPPRLPSARVMSKALTQSHLPRLAAIIATTAETGLSTPDMNNSMMVVPLIIERMQVASHIQDMQDPAIDAAVELFRLVWGMISSLHEAKQPLCADLLSFAGNYNLETIALLCLKRPHQMYKLGVMSFFRLMLYGQQTGFNLRSLATLQLRLEMQGMTKYASEMFHQYVNVDWKSLAPSMRDQHITDMTDLTDLVGKIVMLHRETTEVLITLYKSLHELLKHIGAFVKLKKPVKLPEAKGCSSLKRGFFSKSTAKPALFDNRFQALVSKVCQLLSPLTSYLQLRHSQTRTGKSSAKAFVSSYELAIADLELLWLHKLVSEASEAKIHETLICLLSATFVSWIWQSYMLVYSMLGLCSKQNFPEPELLPECVVRQLMATLQAMASTDKLMLKRYLYPYRASKKDNATAVMHQQQMSQYKVLYFIALGTFLSDYRDYEDSTCLQEEAVWLWAEEIPAMADHVAGLQKNIGLSFKTCVDFMWFAYTFSVKADLVQELAEVLLSCYNSYMSRCFEKAEMELADKAALIDCDMFLEHFACKCEDAKIQTQRTGKSCLDGAAKRFAEVTIQFAVRMVKAKQAAPLQDNMDADTCRLSIQIFNRAMQAIRILSKTSFWSSVVLEEDLLLLYRSGCKLYWLWRLKLWYCNEMLTESLDEYDKEVADFLCTWQSPAQIAAKDLQALKSIRYLMDSYVDIVRVLPRCCETDKGLSAGLIRNLAVSEIRNWWGFVAVRYEIERLEADPLRKKALEKMGPVSYIAAWKDGKFDSQSLRRPYPKQCPVSGVSEPAWWETEAELLQNSEGWGFVGVRGGAASQVVSSAAETTERPVAATDKAALAILADADLLDPDGPWEDLELLIKSKALMLALMNSPVMKALQALWEKEAVSGGKGQTVTKKGSVRVDVLHEMIYCLKPGRIEQMRELLSHLATFLTAKGFQAVGTALVSLQAGCMAHILGFVYRHLEQMGESNVLQIFNNMMSKPVCDYHMWARGLSETELQELSRQVAKELLGSCTNDGWFPADSFPQKANQTRGSENPARQAAGQSAESAVDKVYLMQKATAHSDELLKLRMLKSLQAVRDRSDDLASMAKFCNFSILAEMTMPHYNLSGSALTKFLKQMREDITEEEYAWGGCLLNWLEAGKFLETMCGLIDVISSQCQQNRTDSAFEVPEALTLLQLPPLIDFHTWKSATRSLTEALLTEQAMDDWTAKAAKAIRSKMQVPVQTPPPHVEMTDVAEALRARIQKADQVQHPGSQFTGGSGKVGDTETPLEAETEVKNSQEAKAVKGPPKNSAAVQDSKDLEKEEEQPLPHRERSVPARRKDTPTVARMKKRLAAQKPNEAQSKDCKGQGDSASGSSKLQTNEPSSIRNKVEAAVSSREQVAERMAMELLQEEAREKDKLAKTAAKQEKKKQKLKRRAKTEEFIKPAEQADSVVSEASASGHTVLQEEDVTVVDAPDALSQESVILEDEDAQQDKKSSKRPLSKPSVLTVPRPPNKPPGLAKPTHVRSSHESAAGRDSPDRNQVLLEETSSQWKSVNNGRRSAAQSHNSLAPSKKTKQAGIKESGATVLQRPAPPGVVSAQALQRYDAENTPAEQVRPRQQTLNNDDRILKVNASATPSQGHLDRPSTLSASRQQFDAQPQLIPSPELHVNARETLDSALVPLSSSRSESRAPVAKYQPGLSQKQSTERGILDDHPEGTQLPDHNLQAPPQRPTPPSRSSAVKPQHNLSELASKNAQPSSLQPPSVQNTTFSKAGARQPREEFLFGQFTASNSSRQSGIAAAVVKKDIEEPSRLAKWNCSEEFFVCPITQEVFIDPVFAQDGETYERSAITQWLENHDTSPMFNEKLSSKALVPNRLLKRMIQMNVQHGRSLSD